MGVEPGWSPHDHDDEQVEDLLFRAARLYDRLIGGDAPEPIGVTVILSQGEVAYLDEPMQCARYYNPTGQDAVATAKGLIASAIHARDGSDQLLGPLWRDAHVTRVVLTSRRLLVSLEGQWLSFWHKTVAEFLPSLADLCLVLTFHDTAPLRVRGPNLPTLAVALGGLLFTREQLPDIPEFARFDANRPDPA